MTKTTPQEMKYKCLGCDTEWTEGQLNIRWDKSKRCGDYLCGARVVEVKPKQKPPNTGAAKTPA